jgi:hypothetical protein
MNNNNDNDDYASRKRNGPVQQFSDHHHLIERSEVFTEQNDQRRQVHKQIKN